MIWAQNHEQVEIPRIFLKNRQLGFLYLRGTTYPNFGRVLPDDWGRGWGGGGLKILLTDQYQRSQDLERDGYWLTE